MSYSFGLCRCHNYGISSCAQMIPFFWLFFLFYVIFEDQVLRNSPLLPCRSKSSLCMLPLQGLSDDTKNPLISPTPTKTYDKLTIKQTNHFFECMEFYAMFCFVFPSSQTGITCLADEHHLFFVAKRKKMFLRYGSWTNRLEIRQAHKE